MRRMTAWAAGLAAGIAIGAGTAQRWGSDISSTLASIPQPVATIVAAAIAVAVTAWQGRKALRQVIEGQNHRARIERDARHEQDQLDRRQAFDAEARNKFEALNAALDDHHRWIELEQAKLVFGSTEANEGRPVMTKAIAIASVYFPEILVPLMQLNIAGDEYLQWARGRALTRMRDGADANMGERLLEEMRSLYSPYIRQRSEVLQQLRSLATEQLRPAIAAQENA